MQTREEKDYMSLDSDEVVGEAGGDGYTLLVDSVQSTEDQPNGVVPDNAIKVPSALCQQHKNAITHLEKELEKITLQLKWATRDRDSAYNEVQRLLAIQGNQGENIRKAMHLQKAGIILDSTNVILNLTTPPKRSTNDTHLEALIEVARQQHEQQCMKYEEVHQSKMALQKEIEKHSIEVHRLGVLMVGPDLAHFISEPIRFPR